MKTAKDCIVIMFVDCWNCERDKRICISPGTVCRVMCDISMNMLLGGEY